MTTVPQSQPKLRFRRPPLPLLIAAVLLVAVLATIVVPRLTGAGADPLAGGTTVAVVSGELIAGIGATGRIEPRQEAALAFGGAGRVAEVLVAEGDTVAAGQPLLRLDSRELSAQVTAAQAALAQAQADLDLLREGATAAEIAQAEAQVAAARGALSQTAGSVTPADLAAARARVDEARARLATLQGSPNSDALTTTRSTLTEAQADLDRQRSALATAKVDAERRVFEAANRLRDAQAAFTTARDNLASVEDDGRDPLTGAPLTDAGERSFVTAFQQAERAMADADAALAQARVDYETARQNEVSGLRQAEARVAQAQTQLDTLLTPNADTLANARAALAQAEAELARLQGEQRQGALAAQQGNLAAAEANLARLTSDPRASELARADARVAQAQAQLELAQIQLDDATLRAPFAGIVASVAVAPGEQVGQTAPVSLIDVSRFNVTVTVDEVDVARVQVGQEVQVLIDALGPPALRGTVVRVAPQALADREVTSYEVELEVEPGERLVRAGMTASATIVVDRRAQALSVPAEAVREENGATVVSVVTTDASGRTQVVTRPVEVGLRADGQVEIVSGLSAGQQVLLPASE